MTNISPVMQDMLVGLLTSWAIIEGVKLGYTFGIFLKGIL